jgi:hypothetical protein
VRSLLANKFVRHSFFHWGILSAALVVTTHKFDGRRMEMMQMPNEMAMGRMIMQQEEAIKRILNGDSLRDATSAIRGSLSNPEVRQILDQLVPWPTPDVAAVKDAITKLQTLAQTNPAAFLDCFSIQTVLKYYLEAKAKPGGGEKPASQQTAVKEEQPKKAEVQEKQPQSPAMEYFEVPEARPGQDGICSDNGCPCGFPGAKIPRGMGYIYISKAVVDFRKDARTLREAELKMASMEKQMNALVMFDQNTVTATLMCEQGARKRGLDLAVAAADAKHWWETGLVPLRETPLARKVEAKAAVQRPVAAPPISAKPIQPAATAPVVSAPITTSPAVSVPNAKSPLIAALLSFVFLGGGGHLYLGQWKKGLALMAGTFFLNFVLIGAVAGILGVGDAYGTAKKMNAGNPVEEWQLNINWKAVGLAALLDAIVICGILLLVFWGQANIVIQP